MTTRKDFIGASALLAAAVPAVAKAQPASAAAPFDLNTFHAILDKKAAHKHLFQIRKSESGTGIIAMGTTMQVYQDLGVPSSDLLFVGVLHHGTSIAFAFDDAIWDKYPRALLQKDAAKLTSNEEDLATVASMAKTGNPMKVQITSFATTCNAHLFVCSEALKGWTEYLAKQLGYQASDAYAEFVAALLPNASTVPAGVWAIHAIQERGFTLLPTT